MEDGQNMDDYCFPKRRLFLNNHVSDNSTIEVNSRECMEYLTAEADPSKMLEDPIIKSNK